MEMRHLRYFVAVAETENVSRAALRLHVSQPTLSTQIRDLEAEIGVKLFERTAKSLSLTRAGHVFLDEARGLLRQAEEAVRKAQAAASSAMAEVHVGYSPTPTARILPRVLRAFQATMPGVRVRLHDLTNNENIASLRDGRLHVAFILLTKKTSQLRSLLIEELGRETVRLMVPAGHHLARRKSVTLEEAAREPFVVYSRRDYPDFHEWFGRIFAGVKTLPRIVEEHDGISSLLPSVEAGIGVALGADFSGILRGNLVRLVALRPELEPVSICIATRKGRQSPEVEEFRRCTIEAARQAPRH